MGCCSRLWRGRKICLSMRKPHRRLLTWRRHTPSVSPATILLLTGTSEPPCRWHLCFLRLMAWKSQPVRKMRASRSCGLRQGKLQNPRWLNGLENTPLDPAVARESCRLPGGRPDFRSSISTLPASRASRRTAFRCKIMNVRSKILLWPGMTIVFQCDCWGFMDAFSSALHTPFPGRSSPISLNFPLLSCTAGGPDCAGVSPRTSVISDGRSRNGSRSYACW